MGKHVTMAIQILAQTNCAADDREPNPEPKANKDNLH
jgi:hypothetical protein